MSSESQNKVETPPSARDRILSVAGRLFYREGYRAVGIDRVIAEADVAKATFYKHFPSKDDLIVAWINQAEATSSKHLPSADGPHPLIAYADAMVDIALQPYCLGCTYQGTAAEFVDPAHPAHAASLGVKERVLAMLAERATKEGHADAKSVAEGIYLLLEGVWATSRMFGAKAPLSHAKAAIRKLAS
jgi:AcrR family transcriptional regulator